MDQLFCPTSSGGSPSSLLSAVYGGRRQVFQFASCEIPEQWLADEDGLDLPLKNGDDGNDDEQCDEQRVPAEKRRGRKPGSRTEGAVINHVEAERQRRNKLNRQFCDLRAVVPRVTRMDRASLLADATSYIAELRGRIEKLEAEAKLAAVVSTPPFGPKDKLEVRMMMGREAAAIRLTSAERHSPARFMDALRLMDLPVQHASVCRAGGVTVHDSVVDLPAGPLQDEAWLRAALLHRLQGSGSQSYFQIN